MHLASAADRQNSASAVCRRMPGACCRLLVHVHHIADSGPVCCRRTKRRTPRLQEPACGTCLGACHLSGRFCDGTQLAVARNCLISPVRSRFDSAAEFRQDQVDLHEAGVRSERDDVWRLGPVGEHPQNSQAGMRPDVCLTCE